MWDYFLAVCSYFLEFRLVLGLKVVRQVAETNCTWPGNRSTHNPCRNDFLIFLKKHVLKC